MSNLRNSSSNTSVPPFSSSFSSDPRMLNYAQTAPESSVSSERSVFWAGNEFQLPSSSQISSRGGSHGIYTRASSSTGDKSPARTDGTDLSPRIDTNRTGNFAESSRNFDSFMNMNVDRSQTNNRNIVNSAERVTESILRERADDIDRMEGRSDFRDRFRDAYRERFGTVPRSQSSRLRESYGDRFGDRFREEYGDGSVERSIEWGNERGIEYPRIEGAGRRRSERGEWRRERRDETSRMPLPLPLIQNNDHVFQTIEPTQTRNVLETSYSDSIRLNGVGNGYGGTVYGENGGRGGNGRGNGTNTDMTLGTYPAVDADRSASDFNGRSAPSGFSMFKSLCQEMYRVDWMPREFFVKFRQHIGKFRLGANVEFRRRIMEEEEQYGEGEYREVDRYRGRRTSNHNAFPSLWGFEIQNYKVKFTLKPAKPNPQWKVLCEPQQGDIRFLSRKICVANLFNFQIGIGHDFHYHTTGLKWKISSPIAGINPPQIRHKNNLPVFPGCDLRVGWNADYSFPHLHGSLGTGEPVVGLNLGRLNASIERIETIFTHLH